MHVSTQSEKLSGSNFYQYLFISRKSFSIHLYVWALFLFVSSDKMACSSSSSTASSLSAGLQAEINGAMLHVLAAQADYRKAKESGAIQSEIDSLLRVYESATEIYKSLLQGMACLRRFHQMFFC